MWLLVVCLPFGQVGLGCTGGTNAAKLPGHRGCAGCVARVEVTGVGRCRPCVPGGCGGLGEWWYAMISALVSTQGEPLLCMQGLACLDVGKSMLRSYDLLGHICRTVWWTCGWTGQDGQACVNAEAL